MKGRSYGIDLLKSVSMLMIVMLHILGIGGILDAVAQGTWGYYTAWMMEALNICAVNCFGLVSGYVLSRGRYRASRLLTLWLHVVAEALLITLIFWLIMPESIGKDQLLNVFLPVTRNVYWYFTAYFALFFFVPYINKLLRGLSRTGGYTLGILVALFSAGLSNLGSGDIYHFGGGYSFLWLFSLYIMGGVLRTIPIKQKISKLWFLAVFFALSLISVALAAAAGVQGMVLSYTNPLNLASAAVLLLFFRRLEFKGKFSQKCISMLARTSFGVYIIHTSPLIWTYVISGSFARLSGLAAPLMMLSVLGCALGIYALCTGADWLVEKLLKLLGIERLGSRFDDFVHHCVKSVQKRQKPALK